jgi:NAD(P)-dependent dehydrogenase (short-subunit alcohol dehydrogenase family)
MGPITTYQDMVAVVTGGASGVGRSLAAMMLDRGATVVIADVEKEALDATVAELSSRGTIEGVQTDVTDTKSVQALADHVFERYGRTNLLFNNAGVGGAAPKVWDCTPNDWNWNIAVNVFGVAYGIHHFVPRMIDSGEPGYVVNTTSHNGAVTMLPHSSVYAVSKAAVAVLTECLESQLREVAPNVGAGLLFPAGQGLMGTGMYTADRNRPDRWAREVPKAEPPAQFAAMIERNLQMRGQFVEALDELANSVLDGILEGNYILTLGEFDSSVERLRERADRYAAGLNPTPPSTALTAT